MYSDARPTQATQRWRCRLLYFDGMASIVSQSEKDAKATDIILTALLGTGIETGECEEVCFEAKVSLTDCCAAALRQSFPVGV